MANWFGNQSDLALRQSHWEYAQALAEQSVERYRKHDNRLGIAYALANLTEAASRLDRHEVADVSAREAIAICTETHHHDIVPVILCALARSRTARVRAKSAAVLFTAAARIRTLLQSSTTPEEECELAALEGVIRSHDNGDFLMAAEVKFSAMDGGAVLAELLTQD